MSISLTPLVALTVGTPTGNVVEQPDADSQLVYNYLQQFAAAINARVASPSDKSIVIPAPAVVTSYSMGTPFGKMNFQYKSETLLILNGLGQLAAGINAIWNQ
jgi:hypothetical protein